MEGNVLNWWNDIRRIDNGQYDDHVFMRLAHMLEQMNLRRDYEVTKKLRLQFPVGVSPSFDIK